MVPQGYGRQGEGGGQKTEDRGQRTDPTACSALDAQTGILHALMGSGRNESIATCLARVEEDACFPGLSVHGCTGDRSGPHMNQRLKRLEVI